MVSDAELTDVLYPFQIDAGLVRGRLVRLKESADAILKAHDDYPEPVAALLAEALAVTAALAGGLKFDGIFSLQAQGDGPLSLMVVDVTSAGDLRGYARFDKERLGENNAGLPFALLGRGHLAFTVDQGEHTERYQGIVDLEGRTLSEAVEAYFQQSEQLETVFRIAAERDGAGWCAVALMIQRIPAESEGAPILTAEEAEENWNRATMLLATLKEHEMLDQSLAPERLLYRLYHDDALRVSAPRPLRAQCRCSAERLTRMLGSLSTEERAAIVEENGRIEAVCEFCKRVYSFTENDFNLFEKES